MTWLTWRQHRAEAITAGAVLAALAIVLVALGIPMHAASRTAVACTDGAITDTNLCSAALSQFERDYAYAPNLLLVLNLVPFAVGALIGAPLLARELETGTWQLAWTQAVPRMRWLVVKLAATAALTLAVTAPLAALVTWYRQPLDTLYGRFGIDSFNVEGAAPAAYALFAFGTGVAAGAVLRRTLPAITTTLITFVVVRVTVEGWLRPRYQTPVNRVDDIEAGAPGIPIGTGNPTDWNIDRGLIQHGHRLNDEQLRNLADAAGNANVALSTFLHDNGVQRAITYHPAGRFWTFQLIEAGIFTALTAALLAVAIWRVKRRLA